MPKLQKLPGSNTIRYKLRYTAGGVAHSITVHVVDGTTEAACVQAALALANAIKPLVTGETVFSSVEFAAKGSDVFNQVGTLNVTGTIGQSSSNANRPIEAVLSARSGTGRKTRIGIFGWGLGVPANYKILASANLTVQTAITAIANGAGSIACIDQSAPFWKNYVTVSYNDHVVKVIRKQ